MLSRAAGGATSTTKKWLSVVGIGENGADGLGEQARRLISEAEIVFGGARHLALARPLIAGEARAWPTPFDASMTGVRELSGRPVCVLASGDPFLFGVGATLARVVPAEEMLVVPAPSAFSLAASRLGWALQSIETISLHGRSPDLLRPLLHPERQILALTSDEHGPAAIAALLTENGFGSSRLTLLEALGGERERVRETQANAFDFTDVRPLNLVAIEVVADQGARILPLATGLDDAMFEHDGQLTKREVRAATLSSLAPRRGELLWDIGAGSGSISIEWMLADPSMRAFAVEADAVRASRISRNANACGVPGLTVVHGAAPAALDDLPSPDAIFVGGGGSEPGVMVAAMEALRPGGRMVANAVTLEMESILLRLHAERGGSLIRIVIARAEPVGAMTGWRSAMPVTQWSWVKP